MTDVSGLSGLDPYDLQDRECRRLRDWFASLDEAGWSVPSACEGWSRRDVLGHVDAVEEYFTACLDGNVAALIQRYVEAGGTSLDDFNAAGVAAAAELPVEELLDRWAERNAANRARFRAADGTEIDTSVGVYPCRLQAFHVAFEYAIHADDVDARVAPDELDGRQDWLAGVARFALTEIHDDVTVEGTADGLVVSRGDETATFGRDAFVAGVAGRSAPGALGDPERALLDLGY